MNEEEIRESGQKTPKEFLLAVMHHPDISIGLRIDAAKSLMPYVHKKLPTAIETSGELQVILPYLPTRQEMKEAWEKDDSE